MKNIPVISTFVFSATLFSNSVHAQITIGNGNSNDYLNTVTTAMPFLRMTPDARSGGMGDVGIATSADVNSIYWNASKLVFVDDDKPSAISFNYAPFSDNLIKGIYLANLNGYQKLSDKSFLSSSLRYLSLGNMSFTGTGVINDFHAREFAFDVAYSRKIFDNFSAGINMKYLYSNIPTIQFNNGVQIKPSQAIAGDLSFFYTNKFESVGKSTELGLGLNISNIGNKITYTNSVEKDYLPTNLGIGVSYGINLNEYNKITLAVDLNKLMVPTPDTSDIQPQNGIPDFREQNVFSGMINSFSDAPYGFNEELHEITISTGIEYRFDNKFAVRTGYFYEHATKGGRQFYTLGTGVHYNAFGIDFSYLIPTQNNQNPLDDIFHLSLSLNLNSIVLSVKSRHGEGTLG